MPSSGRKSAKAEPPFEDSRDFVQSLARGLAVLRAFDGEHSRLTLAEIAARSKLSRAAARRLVLTLQHLGYVRGGGRDFVLSPSVLELGFGYLDSLNLTEIATPLLEELARKVDQSSSMAVLDGQSIVYVLRVPGRRIMSVRLGVGARLPACSASLGRVLLAGLPDDSLRAWMRICQPARYTAHTITDRDELLRIIAGVRDQGYAYIEQELELGLCSIAVPLRNAQGQVASAINISLPYQPKAAQQAINQILPQLRKTAAAIEACVPTHLLPTVSP